VDTKSKIAHTDAGRHLRTEDPAIGPANVSKGELFAALDSAMTAIGVDRSDVIKRFSSMSPEEGFREAKSYLETAKRGKEDFTWDTHQSLECDYALAECMVAVFHRLKGGDPDFPPLIKSGEDFVPNSVASLWVGTYYLIEWAKDLVSDHHHQWDYCTHWSQNGWKGNKPACKEEMRIYQGSMCDIPPKEESDKRYLRVGDYRYNSTMHYMCTQCGETIESFDFLDKLG
jgi:hypothetical protein